MEDKSQLEGWILADEPYDGRQAELGGYREGMYSMLKSWRDVIEATDTNSASHPIYTIIRGWGNYDTGTSSPPPPEWLNCLDVGDYIHDDLYLGDYYKKWGDDAGPWIEHATHRTEVAMHYLVEPATGPSPAWLLWSQGSIIADATRNPTQPEGGDHEKLLTVEQLRYVTYAAWISGAQGAMFWNLTQSDYTPFRDVNKYIIPEAHLVCTYLMEEDAGIQAVITSSQGDESAQFILRRHLDDSSKVLLMLCNNSSSEAEDVWVHFPSGCKIADVDQLVDWYNWSYELDGDYKFGLGMGAWTARALILTVDES